MGIFAVFTLSLSTLIVTASDAQIPQPSEDALVKAEKEVRELFASDLSKANSPTDKAKLAKYFLVTANKTIDDDVGHLVLLTLSRDLAIEGKNRKTALDAVSAIVERYQPAQGEPTDGKGQFDKAQELWKEAEKEKASSVEQIRLQIQAAEWYARAKADVTGLTRLVCEKRLAEVINDESGLSNDKQGLLDGCVLYFAFEKKDFFQKGGKVWVRDRSGKGNHGAVIGGAKPAKGKIGIGLELDGKSSCVEVANSPSLNPPVFTLVSWVKIFGWNGGSTPVIAKDEWPNNQNKGYTMRFDGRSGFLDCTIGANGWVVAKAEKEIIIDQWAHLASTCDGAKLIVYLNGMAVASHAVAPIVPSACSLMIGNRPYWFSDHRLNGVVDEVAVFSRSFTAEEILQISRSGQNDLISKQLCEKRLDELSQDGKINSALSDNIKTLIGTWDIRIGNDKGCWTFEKDKTIHGNPGYGRWEIVNNRIMIRWDKDANAWETFDFPIKEKLTRGDSWRGKGALTARKIN